MARVKILAISLAQNYLTSAKRVDSDYNYSAARYPLFADRPALLRRRDVIGADQSTVTRPWHYATLQRPDVGSD